MQTGIHLSLSLHCNFFQHSVTSVVRLGCSFIAAGAGSWRCWTRWQDSHRKTHENLRLICVLKRCRAKQQSFSLSLSDLSPAFPASFSVSLISYFHSSSFLYTPVTIFTCHYSSTRCPHLIPIPLVCCSAITRNTVVHLLGKIEKETKSPRSSGIFILCIKICLGTVIFKTKC